MSFGRLLLLTALAPLLLDGALLYRLDFDFDQQKQRQITQEKSMKVQREIREPILSPTIAEEIEERKEAEIRSENSVLEYQKQQERWQQFKHDCFFTPVNCRIRQPILPRRMKQQKQRRREMNSGEIAEMIELIDRFELNGNEAKMKQNSNNYQRQENGLRHRRMNGKRRRPSTPGIGMRR